MFYVLFLSRNELSLDSHREPFFLIFGIEFTFVTVTYPTPIVLFCNILIYTFINPSGK